MMILGLVLAACGGGADDLLGQIEKDGVIRVFTDANYEPQSFLNHKC
ncbi:MAG: hypothetical protein GY796_34065 [Chloroflexi bacterium]|nr:hypothetical protein [Chloroflexota bacterium]